MKYLILIRTNPSVSAMFAEMDDAERQAAYRSYLDAVDDLEATGELIDSKALDDRTQRIVTRGADGPIVTDAPLPEVTEVITGYYLVEVESEARAAEIATRFPEAAVGGVTIARNLTADELAEFS
ncbi:YciI family protein [Agromyces sp. LHK192]|uniref:YciI family protein n=1 Tax=Agromyces sp. LHK192 TaxID=2498704 RepID=UPI0013E3FFE1|nr:YciI family protein [Agromyces sp. LHK192]